MSSTNDDYRGHRAKKYEETRSGSLKWQFEDDILSVVLDQLKPEIQSIIDAPVGTGRFLEKYARLGNGVHVTGLDYSTDMLELAAARKGATDAGLFQHDIIHSTIPTVADLVVCYRFLNLIRLDEALQAIGHLLAATQKYALFTIRTIEDDYAGETYIENKVYLHRRSEIDRAIVDNGFEAVRQYEFKDLKGGQYSIVLYRRVTGRVLERGLLTTQSRNTSLT